MDADDDECPECVAADRDYDVRECALCRRLLAPLEVDTRAVDVTPSPVWVEQPGGEA